MKITFWKLVGLIIIVVGLYSSYIRFFHGLGASTNLSDEVPWGLWMGFNILCGVVLAAGGFTLCAITYILNLTEFKPIVRPSILIALLGYLLVIAALLFEVGRPERIWYPIIMWNPHSVMFEVAWCVMLYTTVLALEFSPAVFEKFKWHTPMKIVKAITIPLVIIGVILSTLHQSSLGALYLIVPGQLYGLWYSPLLPVFFFISALTVGSAIIIIASYLISRKFGGGLKHPLLVRLAKFIVVSIIVSIVVRAIDLVNRDSVSLLFTSRYETYFYWLEVILGWVIPLGLMSFKTIRLSSTGLFYTALFAVSGVILNRLNVSITGVMEASGVTYFPSLMEISITLMIVTIGITAFNFIAKYFPVFKPNL